VIALNSFLHGPHQVAQTLIAVIFPFSPKEAKSTVLPSKYFTGTLGSF